MAIKQELKEVTALRRKKALLEKSMNSAAQRGAEEEYKRYKQEYEAIDRTIKKHDHTRS